MNRKDVSQIVCKYADEFGPTNRPERKKVVASLMGVNKLELFEGLFSIFLMPNSEQSYTRQQNAGVILFKIKPKVYLNLKDRIRMCLDTWDVSVEELPYYLAEKAGKDTVIGVLHELQTEPLSDRERAALNSFVYWLNPHES